MSLFPIFLLPSVPFRRRTSSIQSDGDSLDSSGQARTIRDKYLTGHTARLRCARCATDLCPTSQIISKGFTGRHGRAYLVSASPLTDPIPQDSHPRYPKSIFLPNTRTHKAMPRQLVTGAHTVSDVSCAFCGSVIGWKYESAEEETQRYKVGKYILETKKIFSSSCWEIEQDGKGVALPARPPGKGQQSWEDAVEFDSQDEDECEDLFAGVWSPALAMKRRQGRRFERAACEQPSSMGYS
ncbi:MAG: hypothetical protein Q9174_000477 [Haloplaca sp. 1 TL-2023]